MLLLKGHVSPETAYLVNDYPYGFRLRCKIRYWLEYKSGKGYRLVSQTTNPKRAGEYWNKPKASTYTFGLEVMALNENNHVVTVAISYSYGDSAKLQERLDLWRDHVRPESIPEAERYIRVKRDYESRMAAGDDFRVAAVKALAADAKRDDTCDTGESH